MSAGSLPAAHFWSWAHLEAVVGHSFAFSGGSLQILSAVAVQLLACAILKKPIAGALPWLVVIVVMAGFEARDFASGGAIELRSALMDFGFSLLLPTILMLGVRCFPRLATWGG
jgi:hypothetical protein